MMRARTAPRSGSRKNERQRGLPKPTLRPYLPADLPLLAEIRLAAIEELTGDDYDESQRRAWADLADDEAGARRNAEEGPEPHRPHQWRACRLHRARRRRRHRPALCAPGGRPHRRRQRAFDAIEKLARARKLDNLVVDASDTAKPLFDKLGFTAERRNTIPVEDVWLGNTRMKKKLK